MISLQFIEFFSCQLVIDGNTFAFDVLIF